MRPLLSPPPIDQPSTDLETASWTQHSLGLTQYIGVQLADKVIGMYVQYVSNGSTKLWSQTPLIQPRYGNFIHVFTCPLFFRSIAAEPI